jgi:medium-chain acyl-[acyl-carrier-protein] hydrolase
MMNMTGATSGAHWFARPKPRPGARVRLFCFPYAGGNSSLYRHWPDGLPDFVEVLTAQLPGRISRLREPAFFDLLRMIESIVGDFEGYLDKPFAFFGHSMGALISFELARRLRRECGREPLHLFPSGCTAPQLPRRPPDIHDLPEPEFLEELRQLNGTPREVLEHPELMGLVLPLLRADFSVAETYKYYDAPPLACPITAFGGLQDPETTREELEGWRAQTSSDFSLHRLPGDHFFLTSAQPYILRVIAQELNRPTDDGRERV